MIAMEADYHRHMAQRFIEVSHEIEAGMQTYPGLPEPRAEVLWDYDTSGARYQGESEFFIASLHLCGNTGTYVDSPVHRFRGGMDLAALPLERLAHLRTVVVDARGSGRAIGPDLIAGLDLGGKAVLFHTGFSRHWRTPAYFQDNPFLTREACQRLVGEGAVFVGIDSLNIDDTGDPVRPAHTLLLGAGTPVCEHMTGLDLVPPTGGYLHAVPIAWRGGASFPVRAYVMVEGP
jgi:kynurenine formamidase